MCDGLAESMVDELRTIEEYADNLLSLLEEISEREVEEKFYSIWKSLQEVLYSLRNLHDSEKNSSELRELVSEILNFCINFSYEILEHVIDRRLRYLVIHVFLDWVINEASRWGVKLQKIEIPSPITSNNMCGTEKSPHLVCDQRVTNFLGTRIENAINLNYSLVVLNFTSISSAQLTERIIDVSTYLEKFYNYPLKRLKNLNLRRINLEDRYPR